MAKKARQPQPKRKMPAAEAEPGAVAAQSVILERIEEQQRVVIEAVTMTRDALGRRIGELDQRLSSKIEVLEFAVRKNSADIQDNSADIQKLSADVQKNTADIQQVSAKVQKNSTDIQQLSAKVQKNSTDIRALSDKLDTKADASRLSAIEQRVEALEA